MFTMMRSRLWGWVVPCCSLILVLYVAQCWNQSQSEKATFPDIFEQAAIDRANNDPKVLEAGLREKAETVLRGYGEDEPCAVVTVAVTTDWEDVETYLPMKEAKALESIQTVGESCEGSTEYRNTKSSENYVIGHTKTVTHRNSPRLTSVSCLVQVSEENADRLPEIEKAVAVALGMQFDRGDVVMASVR